MIATERNALLLGIILKDGTVQVSTRLDAQKGHVGWLADSGIARNEVLGGFALRVLNGNVRHVFTRSALNATFAGDWLPPERRYVLPGALIDELVKVLPMDPVGPHARKDRSDDA